MLISRTIIFFVFPSLFCPFFRYIKIQHKRIRSDCCQVFFYLYYSNAPLSPLHTPASSQAILLQLLRVFESICAATRHCPTICYIPFFLLSCFAISFSLSIFLQTIAAGTITKVFVFLSLKPIFPQILRFWSLVILIVNL